MSRHLPRLMLARHGRTEWNRLGLIQGTTDVPLDSIGRVQADRLACRLANQPLARIYSSPLARALETADRIRSGNRCSPDLVVIDELRELSYGICQGKTLRQWAIVNPDLERRWRTAPQHVRFPNGQTLAHLLDRADSALRGVAEDMKDPDTPALIVAHGHILRALLLRLHGWPVERFWSIDVPNACILTFP